MFSVLLRLPSAQAKALVADSGVKPIYCEPRSESGREPHADYKVVWTPKKSKQQIQILRSQMGGKSDLVRCGNRFAVRVLNADAEKAHQFLRPDVAFLDGQVVQSYKVGPLPYGTTRKSLETLCKEWGWKARPTQPAGQSRDQSGMFWQVHSGQDPRHWIYQLAHGDVLVSKEAKEKPQSTKTNASIVAASRKTMQSLRQSATEPNKGEDPWLARDAGGCSSRQTSQAGSASTGLTDNQINAMEEKVEQKIRQSIASLAPEGSGMKIDDHAQERISALESKVHQLTSSVTQIQHQQGALHGQIQGVQQQVDQQTNKIESILDTKLARQMAQFEAMLAKSRRLE